MDKQQFHEQLTKPLKASLRERERVKSLRDFDLEFHNPNNQIEDTILMVLFNFLIFGRKNKKVEKYLRSIDIKNVIS